MSHIICVEFKQMFNKFSISIAIVLIRSFEFLKKWYFSKKSGLLPFLKTGLFENPDFHQKFLHMRVRILSKPLFTSFLLFQSVKRKLKKLFHVQFIGACT